MARIGGALGLSQTLHARGAMTCGDLAEAAEVHERSLREWLSRNAAAGYL